MSGYPNARDCEHGQLRRSCERCADAFLIAGLSARLAEVEQALRTARFVADHWRKAALESENTRIIAHPLNLVLDALDGVTDPVMLGIDPAAHGEFRAVLDKGEQS